MSTCIPLAAASMTSDYVVDSDAEAEMETESTSVGLGGAAAAVASDNEGEEPRVQISELSGESDPRSWAGSAISDGNRPHYQPWHHDTHSLSGPISAPSDRASEHGR